MAMKYHTTSGEALSWHDSGWNGPEALVDIVLVQGLNADPYYTWTGRQHATGKEQKQKRTFIKQLTLRNSRTKHSTATTITASGEQDFFWPRDLLPPSLPPCTISTYSYPSGWKSRDIKTDLRICGEQFLNILHNDRQNKETRPLVLVGHSLGGLVIHQALVIADHGITFQKIRTSVQGILLLGTPMQGCDIASFGEWATRTAGNDQPLSRLLKSGSTDLLSLIRDFWSGYGHLPIICFHEDAESNIGGLKLKTVSGQLATIVGKRRIYLAADHSGLNKFTGPDDENYLLFLPALQEVIRSAISAPHCLVQPQYDGKEITSSTRGKWVVPFARDPDFVQRGEVMAQIDSMLHNTENSPRIALWGLGGVGKSQIAIEYAYRQRERSPKTSILWIHASNAARFRQSFETIAKELQLPGSDDLKSNQLDVVYHWLLSERSGNWLLILDNADDIDFVRHSHNDRKEWMYEFSIGRYLPQRAGGMVMVTSRSRHAASALASRPTFVLNILSMSDNEAKLLINAKIPVDSSSNADRDMFARMLENIPLAITQAAAYITRNECMTTSKYLRLFDSTETTQISILTSEGGDLRRDSEVPNSVIWTWEISFAQVSSQNQISADLLSCMSLLDRQGIPDILLRQDYSELEFEEAMSMLSQFAFVKVEIDESTFSMHRLVQVATRAWLRRKGKLEHYQNKMLNALNRHYPEVPWFEDWKICRLLEPHATVVMQDEYISDDLILVHADMSNKRADYLIDQGKYELAEHLACSSWTQHARILGIKHPLTLASLRNLSLTYSGQRRYEEAIKIQEQVLEIGQRVLGKEHTEVLAGMDNLASTYCDRGRHEDAIKLQERVLEIRQRISGEEHISTTTSMNNLAHMYAETRLYEDAIKIQEHVLEINQRVFGEEHAHTLTGMNNLGLTYSRVGRFSDAITMHEQSLETRQRVLGREHPNTLGNMVNLATSYHDSGRYQEAIKIHEQVLEIKQRIHGREHSEVLKTMNDLAVAFACMGLYKEAKELLEPVQEMSETMLGQEHHLTLLWAKNLRLCIENERLVS